MEFRISAQLAIVWRWKQENLMYLPMDGSCCFIFKIEFINKLIFLIYLSVMHQIKNKHNFVEWIFCYSGLLSWSLAEFDFQKINRL